MIGKFNMKRLRQAFVDQFFDDGRDVIYRKNQTGAPIRISRKERDGFVENFNKRILQAMWAIILATFGLVPLLYWLSPDSDGPDAQAQIWIGTATVLLFSILLFSRIWGTPFRELGHRTPEGSPLNKKEARVLALSRITYKRLALSALMGIGLVYHMSTKVDIYNGLGLLWLVFGVAVISLAGVQAVQKWHSDQL